MSVDPAILADWSVPACPNCAEREMVVSQGSARCPYCGWGGPATALLPEARSRQDANHALDRHD